MRLHYKYWTKAKGVGGFLKTQEDFAVREIIEPKFLRKFFVNERERKYILFLVKKRDMTTAEAVRKLASLGFRDIGYAGLKDKFSVSWQYVSAIAESIPYELEDLTVMPIGKCKKLFPGNLIGNEFVITLHGCKNISRLYSINKEFSKGMPNYFGLQRFGNNKNNHVIGKYLIKRKFDDALNAINATQKKKFTRIAGVSKHALKFFINAYQSWIFNEMLNEYIETNKKPWFRDANIFGFKTVLGNSCTDRILRNIAKKEGVVAKDFRINELMLSCFGGKRKAFIKLPVIDYIITQKTVKLAFTLPKGSYATVLLREICKNGVRWDTT